MNNRFIKDQAFCTETIYSNVVYLRKISVTMTTKFQIMRSAKNWRGNLRYKHLNFQLFNISFTKQLKLTSKHSPKASGRLVFYAFQILILSKNKIVNQSGSTISLLYFYLRNMFSAFRSL